MQCSTGSAVAQTFVAFLHSSISVQPMYGSPSKPGWQTQIVSTVGIATVHIAFSPQSGQTIFGCENKYMSLTVKITYKNYCGNKNWMTVFSVSLESFFASTVERSFKIKTFRVDITFIQISIGTFIDIDTIHIGTILRILSKTALTYTGIRSFRIDAFFMRSANCCGNAFINVLARNKWRITFIPFPACAQWDIEHFVDCAMSLLSDLFE